MPADKFIREAMLEAYDRNYGTITDAMVDITPARKSLMARPSIHYTTDMGVNLPSGWTDVSMIIFDAIGFYVPLASANPAYYIGWLYQGNTGRVGISIWNLTAGTFVGSFTIYGSGTLETGPGQLAPLANTLYSANIQTGLGIVAGGSGYVTGDIVSINVAGAGGAIQQFVVTASAGAITGLSFPAGTGTIAYYNAIPATNPISLHTVTGVGTGAQISLTWDINYGILIQPRASDGPIAIALVNQPTGAAGYTTNNGPTSSTGTFVRSLIYLSSYNFIVDSSGLIWNCNAGDPTTWNGLNFTQAFSNGYGTVPVALSTHNGYLIALGDNEVRFFYITGAINGSSVSPVLNVSFGIGAYSSTLVDICNEFMGFVGFRDATGFPVFLIPPNSQVPQRISYPYLENLLQSYSLTCARFLTFRGHLAFCIDTSSGVSFLYDITAQTWYSWNIYLDDGQPILDHAIQTEGDVTICIGHNLASNHFYLSYFLPAGNDIVYGGASNVYVPTLTTKPIDLGSIVNKQWISLTLIGDRTNTSQLVTVQYSDDGGYTFQGADTADMSLPRPQIRNKGQSQRRMWQFQLPPTWLVRLDEYELAYRPCAT